MADLTGTLVAENYLKTRETTVMGTRDLAIFVVDMGTDVESNYTDSDSLFSQAVRGLQQRVELYAIFPPSGNYFTVMASSNTAPQDDGDVAGDGNENSVLTDAVNEATGESATVWNANIYGDNISYD